MSFAAGLNIATALFALAAAGLWLWSTMPKLPDKFTSPYSAPPPELQPMADALRQQSRRNAWGAIAAAAAAFCQVVAAFAARPTGKSNSQLETNRQVGDCQHDAASRT